MPVMESVPIALFMMAIVFLVLVALQIFVKFFSFVMLKMQNRKGRR